VLQVLVVTALVFIISIVCVQAYLFLALMLGCVFVSDELVGMIRLFLTPSDDDTDMIHDRKLLGTGLSTNHHSVIRGTTRADHDDCLLSRSITRGDQSSPFDDGEWSSAALSSSTYRI
jgi:hypothetical protein